MATKKKLFSYDDEFDKDIVSYFNSLPSRKHSDYIRKALRLLMSMENNGQMMHTLHFQTPIVPEVNEQDFEEIDDSFFEFGIEEDE